MTREAFLAAYRRLLVKHCDWAANAEKLDTFMRGVVGTISQPDGASLWSFDTKLSRAAYKEIGGTGKPRLKDLRALPSEERT